MDGNAPRSCMLVLAWLAAASAAHAHELCLKAEKRQGQIYVEAWYDNDVPADGARVAVLRDGQPLLEGVTDERGVWTADCPPAGAYRVRVTDGGGHKAEVDFVLAAEVATQKAGTTREEVAERRWTGTVLGLAVLAGLVVAGRWLLRARGHTAPTG